MIEQKDFINGISSLIASFASTALTHPFDVLKTQIQLSSGQSGLSTCFDHMLKASLHFPIILIIFVAII